MSTPALAAGLPRYELRVRLHAQTDAEWEIWQLPTPAMPHLKTPVRVAGLRGRNLALIEHRLLRRLAKVKIDLGGLLLRETRAFPLDEDLALGLGLLFRVLAPMRNRDYMLACMAGIEAMSREEAAYWLGMALHRPHPRRVLMALRILLIDPHAPRQVS